MTRQTLAGWAKQIADGAFIDKSNRIYPPKLHKNFMTIYPGQNFV